MHVVMIGAKKQAMDALLAAGHQVTVLYEPWEEKRATSVLPLARHSCAVDSMRSVESLWSALHQIGALAEPVGAVIANSETCVVSAAVLGKLLGARALEPDVALRCRDKAVQKHAWRAASVPTARFVVSPDVVLHSRPLPELVADAGLQPPFFIKPTSGYGTRNVTSAQSFAELAALVPLLVEATPSMRRLLVEEQVNGDEWHFDGVLVQGQLIAFCVSRYLTPVYQTKLGNPVASVCFPIESNEALYAAARSLALRATRALGHVNGVFHLEAFAESGSMSFVAGELAARVGGNSASEIIARTTGMDPWVAAALTITGDPIPSGPVSGKTYGIVSLPSEGGKTNCVAAEHLSRLPGVVEVLALLPVGACMPAMGETSSSCIGFALVEESSFEACCSAIEGVICAVRERNRASVPPSVDSEPTRHVLPSRKSSSLEDGNRGPAPPAV